MNRGAAPRKPNRYPGSKMGKPLLKWPGGKRALLSEILPLIRKTSGRYFEPFIGGGAVYFALRPARATIADIDPDLTNCYQQLRDRPHKVIAALRRFPNSEGDYYRIRTLTPRSETEAAARLIYLTTLSFNGIYRRNLRGEFNVPYGYKTHLVPCDESLILEVSGVLANAEIRCCDFNDVCVEAKTGDMVYCDPPYTVAHNSNGFVKYNSKIFSWPDQVRLAKTMKQLAALGCQVIISNALHESVIELYKGFKVKTVTRNSVIAASSIFRQEIHECLIYNVG